MNIRRLSDMVSPQIGAVSGGRQPVLSEENYIEGMADELPAIEEAEYNRSMTEERMQMDRDARSQARSDSNTSMAMETANLGIKAYPYLSKLAAGKTATALVPAVTNAGAGTGAGIGLSEVAGIPGYGATAGTGAAVGGAPAVGTLASMVPGAAGYVGAKIGGDKFTRQVGSLGGMVKNKTDQRHIGGAVKGGMAGVGAGALLGAQMGAWGGPAGSLAGAAVGGLYGAISGLFSSW